MTAATSYTTLATIQSALSGAARLALAGFLPAPAASPGGLRPGPAAVHRLVPCPLAAAVRRPARRHRNVREAVGGPGPRPRHLARRLCTIAGFYKYAVKEELLGHSLQRTSAVLAGLRIAPRRWTA
jgi:hypothetical protein